MIDKLYDIVTVDVGEHTGYAYWYGDIFPFVRCFSLDKSIKKLEEKIDYMCGLFADCICERPAIEKVYIEGAELWEGSLKSLTSAKRGNTFWLAYLAGAYMAMCFINNIQVEILPAREWKGNLSKEGTALRVKRINGMTYENDHITDAVAMGLSLVPDVWNLKIKDK